MPAVAPYAALVAVGGFGVVAPALSRASRPALATWLLSVGAVISAASTVVVLLMMSLPLVGRDDAFVDYANVSARLLDKDTGSGLGVAAVAFSALALLLVRVARQFALQRRDRAQASALVRAIRAAPGQLVVLPQDDVDIFAVGGRGGMIVATRGLLRCLSPEHRRAVLLHEHAHLRYHHHRHLCALALAASVNPLMWRIPAAGALAVERWADESSAASTSRTTTAEALSVVSERRSPQGVGGCRARMAATSVAVAYRIAALQGNTARSQPIRVSLVVALPIVALAATSVTAVRVLDLFAAATAATGGLLTHH